MQPISTMRSPPAGLRPVVSVSKMISRMGPLSTRRQAKTSKDRPHLGARGVETARRIDDEIGARALVGIGPLAGEDRVEPRRGHSGPRQHALALNWFGRRD